MTTGHAALLVLQKAHTHGIGSWSGCSSVRTALPWWKRFVNRLPIWDQPPFIDRLNHWEVDIKPISTFVEVSDVEEFMKTLAPEPACRKCGSKHLAPDPSGYYWDAVRWDGAPLLCLDCDG